MSAGLVKKLISEKLKKKTSRRCDLDNRMNNSRLVNCIRLWQLALENKLLQEKRAMVALLS